MRGVRGKMMSEMPIMRSTSASDSGEKPERDASPQSAASYEIGCMSDHAIAQFSLWLQTADRRRPFRSRQGEGRANSMSLMRRLFLPRTQI
jgi:hypothetical protein